MTYILNFIETWYFIISPVKRAIVSKYVEFVFLSGKENLADILSKYWEHSKFYPLLCPLLFWSGDTMDSEWIYIFIYYILYIYDVIEGVRCTLQKVMELTQMLLCSHFLIIPLFPDIALQL